MTRYELEFYSHNVPAIRKALERIATALEENNTLPCDKIDSAELDNFRGKDIPGFEGTLDALDNLYQPSSTRKAILEQQALNRKIAEKDAVDLMSWSESTLIPCKSCS